jgi:hypothetical protein
LREARGHSRVRCAWHAGAVPTQRCAPLPARHAASSRTEPRQRAADRQIVSLSCRLAAAIIRHTSRREGSPQVLWSGSHGRHLLGGMRRIMRHAPEAALTRSQGMRPVAAPAHTPPHCRLRSRAAAGSLADRPMLGSCRGTAGRLAAVQGGQLAGPCHRQRQYAHPRCRRMRMPVPGGCKPRPQGASSVSHVEGRTRGQCGVCDTWRPYSSKTAWWS